MNGKSNKNYVILLIILFIVHCCPKTVASVRQLGTLKNQDLFDFTDNSKKLPAHHISNKPRMNFFLNWSISYFQANEFKTLSQCRKKNQI